ncbi:efflux RND transporter periplasmic adaptor subunit [Desulfuribacillus alkaliarsenatis]|uniref:Uncharacterized protein n=1 Tax=Desulfuribacillus alkaliarsenatis TaxID=766136 RepID=A0A1E5FZJ1_9FIRM|nr:HlyD family efflux transporter periplasmic adaptor subunit [Desulfuribacillus alkaliarsenatis]OEF95868.1 hypothetical protein BHF68_10765 [Desulfuribacillus alkaliarsenatis]
MKKFIKWTFFIVILGLGAGYMYWQSIQPLAVETLAVSYQDIEQVIEEEAVVAAIREQSVFALAQGKVENVSFEVGKPVKQGQLLFSISNRELEFQVAQLRAQLVALDGQEQQMYPELRPSRIQQQELAIEDALMRYEIAKEDYERIKALYEAGAISYEAYQQADRAVTTLRHAVIQQEQALEALKDEFIPLPGISEQFAGQRESIEAQIAMAEYLLSQSRVYAPFSGVVKEKRIENNMVVHPGFEAAILFADNQYELETYILTKDMIDIYLGMPVTIIQERARGDIEFVGEVVRIAPVAVETVSALGLRESRIKVTIGIDQEQIPDTVELRPGYRFDVKFVTHREENRIVLPKTSLFKYQGTDAIWVINNDIAEIKKVNTGFETSDRVVIETGLVSGDRIIRNPRFDNLREGIEVVEKEN